ncbi:MAG: carboxypeptidase regulatory-like domain-containing protein, partial [Gammaproteobacteria bacterium]
MEGAVRDSSEAVLPAASVTVTETATGRKITLKTNDFGRYAARNLLPGLYTVRIEAPGLSAWVLDNVPVSAGAVVNGDAVLSVGRAEQVVEVHATAISVDTRRHTVDTVITEQEIRNIPLFNRNFLDLAALAPGVNVSDGGVVDPTKQRGYRAVSIAGRSGAGTRVQIDGIDVTDVGVGTTTANISADAVREFQLTQSSLDISTSLTSSGAVNIISRSGANQVHGSWFWDYYNQDMGARLDYNKEAAPFQRTRTGGAAGGPFRKDRLFWFVNWERHYQTEQLIYSAPEFPQLNVSQEIPIGIRYAKGRADWNVTPATRLFYSFQHDWNLATGDTAVSPFQNINWTNTSTVGLDFSKTRTTHSYRFGHVNFNNRIQSEELTVKFPRFAGEAYFLNVGTFQSGPSRAAPQQTYQDNFQNSYEGSLFSGRHTLRWGLNLTRIVQAGFAGARRTLQVAGAFDLRATEQIRSRGGNPQDPLEYPLLSFTVGPDTGFFLLRPAHNLPHGGHFNTRIAWFLGDSIRVGRGLTLNLGLRWEFDSGYFANDRRVPRDPALETWIRGASSFPEAPKDLFMPSFGFAYDPSGSGKTVVRGGFYKAYETNFNWYSDELAMLPAGIGPDFYNHPLVAGPDGRPIDADGRHPTGDYSDLVQQPIRSVLPLIAQVHRALRAAYANYSFDPARGPSQFRTTGGAGSLIIPGNQFKIPYSLQFNIGLQRELRPGTVLTADYIENHGVGLPYLYPDFERRRDASTLNVAAARAQLNRVLGGLTVDQYIAANPTRNISALGLVNDVIWPGVTPDFLRAALASGGFSRYRGIHLTLRSARGSLKFVRDASYLV